MARTGEELEGTLGGFRVLVGHRPHYQLSAFSVTTPLLSSESGIQNLTRGLPHHQPALPLRSFGGVTALPPLFSVWLVLCSPNG